MKYFNKKEKLIWLFSELIIVCSFIIFDRSNYLTLFASMLGTTAIIINAKGNPLGQAMMIVFCFIYVVISYSYCYYGELITYLGMTMPMAVVGLVAWLRNPYKGNRAEVKINSISKRETVFMLALAAGVTVAFYFILRAFDTKNLIPSTLSVTTSFLAVYLTFRRDPFFSLMYAVNDIILIVLWVLASLEEIKYLSVVICFGAFLICDIYAFYNWQKMKVRQRDE